MKDFAKLYHHSERGQVLVICDTDDEDRPQVQFHAMGPDDSGLGICKVGMSFPDDDSGYERRDEAFEQMTEERAFQCAQPLFALFDNLTTSEDAHAPD